MTVGLCFSIFIFMLFILCVFQCGLSEKLLMKDSSMSSLESGFESIKLSLLLSSPFFFLAVLFVLFDLELVLLFPGVLMMATTLNFILLWGSTMTLVLLTLALEWAWYGLKWQI